MLFLELNYLLDLMRFSSDYFRAGMKLIFFNYYDSMFSEGLAVAYAAPLPRLMRLIDGN